MNEVENMVGMLDSLMESCKKRVDNVTYDEFSKEWRKIDFRRREDGACGPSLEDYENPLFDACYLIKYGYAYAFEYAMIYDAILRTYDGVEGSEGNKILGVVSFGCGSALDAWALDYTKHRLLYIFKDSDKTKYEFLSNLGLRYRGYDQANWAIRFFGSGNLYDVGGDAVDNNYMLSFKRMSVCTDSDIASVFRNQYFELRYYNVFMFGKLLNELNSKQIEELLDAAASIVNNRKEIYFCFSFGKSEIDNSDGGEDRIITFAKKLFDRIRKHGVEYEIAGDVMEKSEYSYLLTHDKPRGQDEAGDAIFDRIYRFNGQIDDHVSSANPSFKAEENLNYVINHTRADDKIHNPMTTLNHFRIQVIKITAIN